VAVTVDITHWTLLALFRCTCPCLDCIEGKHCGGEYTDDDGVFVGECHEIVDEQQAADYWPREDDDE
jgi:hypothetical protein